MSLPRVVEAIGLRKVYPLPAETDELSGGERQRVAIARAIVRRPALLLADEPTGNLDFDNGRKIFGLFRDLAARSRLVVLVATHNLELAALADRLIRLRDGRLVPAGERS